MSRRTSLALMALAWTGSQLAAGCGDPASTSLPGGPEHLVGNDLVDLEATAGSSLAETITALRAARGDQAGIAVESGREIVVAIGQARWNQDMGPGERLGAILSASVRARKAAAAYLFGEGSVSVTRIIERVATTMTESGTTNVVTKERSQFVRRTIAGVLHSMRVREVIEAPADDRLLVILTSETVDAGSMRDGMVVHTNATAAAAAVLDGMADGSIVPCGGMLVWIGEAKRPAVVGLGAVPIKGEHATRGEHLIAGRKAAAGLVAFLNGEEIVGKDEFTEILRTVARDDGRTDASDANPSYHRSMSRLAGSMSKGVVPGGNTPDDRVATLAGNRYLFSVVVVPIEAE